MKTNWEKKIVRDDVADLKRRRLGHGRGQRRKGTVLGKASGARRKRPRQKRYWEKTSKRVWEREKSERENQKKADAFRKNPL